MLEFCLERKSVLLPAAAAHASLSSSSIPIKFNFDTRRSACRPGGHQSWSWIGLRSRLLSFRTLLELQKQRISESFNCPFPLLLYSRILSLTAVVLYVCQLCGQIEITQQHLDLEKRTSSSPLAIRWQRTQKWPRKAFLGRTSDGHVPETHGGVAASRICLTFGGGGGGRSSCAVSCDCELSSSLWKSWDENFAIRAPDGVLGWVDAFLANLQSDPPKMAPAQLFPTSQPRSHNRREGPFISSGGGRANCSESGGE